MKAVKESNIRLNKKVQLSVGTDEESGSQGIKYLFQKKPKPTIGLSPDGDYPVIYAEKGILHGELTMPLKEKSTLILEGGLRANMVPESCACRTSKQNIEKLVKLAKEKQYDYLEDGNVLTVYGKSAHGSMPNKGINACLRMIDIIDSAKIANGTVNETFVTAIKQGFAMETTGELMGINLNDDESGALTVNVGKIHISEKEASVVLDIRYPVTCEKEKIESVLEAFFKPYGLKYKQKMNHAPLFMTPDSAFIQTLLAIYKKHTGEAGKPLAIGGGTYAREIPNAVAFGPNLPGSEDVMHQKDEYIDLDVLLLNSQIYADAILALAT
jgi:succinyl-diaminopimelate desuccinylase